MTTRRPGSPTVTADDPFGTAALRAAVLDAWAASPDRLREDANAEEDLATGGYRDRAAVELVQNGVDAAREAGVPARLLLRLDGMRLLVANTGAALHPAGVRALSSLRASAKRDAAGVTGRFGVGFAAVLAVSDDVRIGSRGAPGVRWSAAAAAREAGSRAARAPALATELGRRGGRVAVLRLPFPAPEAAVPDGYDTVVELELRDEPARFAVTAQLERLDPTLPLVLPGFEELRVEVGSARPRLVRCVREGPDAALDGMRWRGVRCEVDVPAALLAGRPLEERDRPRVIAAYAREDAGPLPEHAEAVLRAPQPTAEPLSLPVVLSVDVPLDPDRRHTVPGPLRDALLGRAGALLAELAVLTRDPLRFVPTGFAAGEVDAAVRDALLAALPGTALLPGGLRGEEAAVLDLAGASGPVTALLQGELAGLLPAEYAERGRAAALRVLGVRRLGPAATVELVQGLDRPARFWGRLYAALAECPDPEALAALPVPLADGRVVTGPRGLLLAGQGAPELAALPLRLLHPDAWTAAGRPGQELLVRLGARSLDSASLLEDPAVRGAIEDSCSLGDPGQQRLLAEAVLSLVAEAQPAPGRLPFLAALALPDAEGRPAPAGELLHPQGVLAPLLAAGGPLAELHPDVAARWPRPVLRAVGVLDTFAVLREPDVPLFGPGELFEEVDGGEDYRAELGRLAPSCPVLEEFVAVRDLELVEDWGAALAVLAGDPVLREAVLAPARGPGLDAPGYTRWWLSGAPVLGGHLPGETVLAGDRHLAGLYEPAPAGLDPVFLAALGCRTGLEDLLGDPDAVADLLDRLADSDRSPDRRQVRVLYGRAARALAGRRVDPPLGVRAVLADRLVVVPPAQAVLVDSPDLLALVTGRPRVPVAARDAPAVAAMLGVPLAGSIVTAGPDAEGERRAVPLTGPWPTHYFWHERLRVQGVACEWRVHDGQLHAATPRGLARALAWAGGRWERRDALAARLEGGYDPVLLDAEDDSEDLAEDLSDRD